MTVNQFDPKQTTTLETPKKVIAQQSLETKQSNVESGSAAKVGFVSLGCRKYA